MDRPGQGLDKALTRRPHTRHRVRQRGQRTAGGHQQDKRRTAGGHRVCQRSKTAGDTKTTRGGHRVCERRGQQGQGRSQRLGPSIFLRENPNSKLFGEEDKVWTRRGQGLETGWQPRPSLCQQEDNRRTRRRGQEEVKNISRGRKTRGGQGATRKRRLRGGKEIKQDTRRTGSGGWAGSTPTVNCLRKNMESIWSVSRLSFPVAAHYQMWLQSSSSFTSQICT